MEHKEHKKIKSLVRKNDGTLEQVAVSLLPPGLPNLNLFHLMEHLMEQVGTLNGTSSKPLKRRP